MIFVRLWIVGLGLKRAQLSAAKHGGGFKFLRVLEAS